jgi:hypothetical protein
MVNFSGLTPTALPSVLALSDNSAAVPQNPLKLSNTFIFDLHAAFINTVIDTVNIFL